MIFFISDIGEYFNRMPYHFVRAFEYVLTNGLLNTSNSQFYIDANAIECFKNLSCECLGLFSAEVVYKTLEVCQAPLFSIPTNYADKLIEALINIISRLPQSEVSAAQRKIIESILNELKNVKPLAVQKSQSFHKGIVLLSAALGAIAENASEETWRAQKDLIKEIVEISLNGLAVFRSQENIMLSLYLLFRRLTKVVNVHSDIFFPRLCDEIIEAYVPGKEEGMAVIIPGLSLLQNEPLTVQWLNMNYLKLFGVLYSAVSQDPCPDTITSFYDLQNKLYESGSQLFSTTLTNVLEVTTVLATKLHDRNSSKSLLQLCQLIFSSRADILTNYALPLTKSLLSSLETISINTYHKLSSVLNNLKLNYSSEFYQGTTLALSSEVYARFQQKEKERLLYCFANADTDTIHQMKQLINIVSNILRGQGTFDSVIAVEIAINSKKLKKT